MMKSLSRFLRIGALFIALIPSTYAEILTQGNAHPAVVIVLYSAFTCPYCKEVQPIIDKVVAQYPGQVRILYKHFPISDSSAALTLQELAAAADAQGRFREMYTTLYTGFGDQPTPERMAAWAHQAGIPDVPQLLTDVQNHRYLAKVQNDADEGKAQGVMATPTLFINGYKLEGLVSQDSLQEMVGFYIKKKQAGQ